MHVLLDWIDGNLGFTGGLGTADQWRVNAQDEAHWRDTHFRVVGPVVAQMQADFIDNWTKAKGQRPQAACCSAQAIFRRQWRTAACRRRCSAAPPAAAAKACT